ncbi:MAG: hypothetical protein HZA90_09030 [Verrucomicrobia bacterium]|nr:hypothetical protein [Verrucomicrobiota bacterium]
MNAPDLAGASLLNSPFYNTDELPESPKPPNPQWRGVLIDAPAQAVLSLKQPMIILRGTYRIQGTNYPANDRLRLVAVDAATKQEYAGTAGQRDPSPDVPPPKTEEPDPEVVKRMVFSGFFNADLVATVKLPRAAGLYRVRAELGNLKSNEITIQVAVQ